MVTDTIYATWYSLTSVLLFFAVAICIRGMARMLDSLFKIICVSDTCMSSVKITVVPRCSGVLGAMEVALLYRVSHCVRARRQGGVEGWGQRGCLVVGGFCCIRPLCDEVPLYS